MVLAHNHITTAPFVVIPGHEESVDWAKLSKNLPAYPVFVKPACEGSSKGISRLSKETSLSRVKTVVAMLRAQYPGQDILLESFLSGRDLSICILGTGSESRVIGVQDFNWDHVRDLDGDSVENAPRMVHKWQIDPREDGDVILSSVCHNLAHPQISAACALALRAWRMLNYRDVG